MRWCERELGGHAGAALAAPSADDGPPRTGAHSQAEAVLARAAAVVRLVCALHG
jgi:hypothetical protein